tara:strand:- start:347 stop:577 length:231 start_codon:yes stop_codon:yes gene_type:complete
MENKYLLEHKDKLIKKLQLEIEETKMVLKGEKCFNEDLKEQVKKYELTIETLQKINDNFLIKILKLRNTIDTLSEK